MNKIMNRIKLAARAVVLGLLTAVFAQGAWAADPVSYLAPVYKTVGGITSPTNGIDHWETKSTNVYQIVTADTATLNEGWWVVDGTVDHSSAGIAVIGAAHLILKDGCALTVRGSDGSSGIQVSGTGNSLAIYGQSTGTGKLTVTGGDNSAGIGGSNGSSNGSNITINGGIVSAKGGDLGSGIGGGSGGSGSNITINGGTVSATGNFLGAGIGGGYGGTGANITINGGTVTASGGSDGDGIGNGADVSSDPTNIKVNPLLTLKAGVSANPTTEIATDRTMEKDVATSLAGRQYVTAKIDYTIVLKDGVAYKSADNGMRLGDSVTPAGLTYANGVWTMNGFNFKTAAMYALHIQGDFATTIMVTGDNSIRAGDGTGAPFGLYVSAATILQGNGSLTVTSGTSTYGASEAIFLGNNLSIRGITLTANSGTASYNYADGINVCAGNTLTVADATVNLNGGTGMWSNGLYNNGTVIVSGTGKIIAKAGTGSASSCGVSGSNEPDAVAQDDRGNELTWSSLSGNDSTYKDAGDAIATTVVLTVVPKLTVVLPAVVGATAQLYVFNANGGWASIATNEVPSNATVRVVWTAENGKGLTGAGAANVFQWQAEFVASKSVQTAPAPTAVEAGETAVTLNIDTRAKKTYYAKEDILPIWYAQGAEVQVGGAALVKSAANTNTVSWAPAAIGEYDLSHTGALAAQIIYTTPVEVTTNGLEVAGTAVAVTVDGSPLPEDGRVVTNSTVVATWTAAPGTFFMDGTATYTQTFTADKAVNAVSAAVTKPEAPAVPKLLLGVVAQRYPWDGKIDVQYWAKNTPNTGYEIEVKVTVKDVEKTEKHPALNGKNVTTFDARAAFGEVQIQKGVKVRATLVPSGIE